ncbi:MAG: primosomal protein N' [Lachnospiraceae bacterium]|nr:primosomal protein N' [Lachnospiraceae bacterium]
MNRKYADIIIDISTEKLDRPFQYRVPEDIADEIEEGSEVLIPFGKGDTERKGYVVGFSDTPQIDISRIKSITGINKKAVTAQGKILSLAAWIRRRYGSTMINALRTVLPVRKKIKEVMYETVWRNKDIQDILEEIGDLNPSRYAARIRLLNALLSAEAIPKTMVTERLNVSASVIKTLEKQGLVRVESTRDYRNPIPAKAVKEENAASGLNDEQQAVLNGIKNEMALESRRPCLIYGVTGSGKTEVYMELAADVIARGKQVIVLIPEIALTFQTLMRFYTRFGNRVSVLHSRLSDGERFDQYERAARGELDIMIGPRSALFTPFPRLGLVVIDEEHETSYKSEKMPKYHAREVAEYLTGREGAGLVLGSATPSLESFYKADKGEYALFEMKKRYGNATLPAAKIVDMREELKAGNKSFLSRALAEALTERLMRGEQSMIFINRRGVAGFVSCRSCGYVVKCPHCDVSMTQHRNGMLVCHYCGHTIPMPKVCPDCGSKYISGFRAGTEAVESGLKDRFPTARIIRMDADSTSKKEDYEKILSSFADGEADILVGTQMIVKGHDFPNVTLVGAIAADMSLHAADYHAAERTFELIAQAAGRAGRGDKSGEVIIQSYDPGHYSLRFASCHDYDSFYKQEIALRKLTGYPPVNHMLVMQFFSRNEAAGMARARYIAALRDREEIAGDGIERPEVIGPAPATIGRIDDIYRIGLYFKHSDVNVLIKLKDAAESIQTACFADRSKPEVSLQFDFDPVGSF